MYRYLVGLLALVLVSVSAYCDDPSPGFPLPNLDAPSKELQAMQKTILEAVKGISSMDKFNTTSFSIEVTSTTKTLFSMYHTASVRNMGAKKIKGKTLYRIASMTKPFTVLAILQQHAKGTLHLDDPVNKYIDRLNEPQKGSLPWHDITIRALASQIGGVPRDMSQSDLVTKPETALQFGLPPESSKSIPQCDSNVNFTRGCNSDDLLNWLKLLRPLFAPNQKSSYSNLNYELLGLVVENVTGMAYSEYVETKILRELGMKDSRFSTPPEKAMAIPAGESYYWNFEMGIAKATGGMYSSAKDLSKFLRWTLTHYNGITPALNWFQPTSWSNSLQSFYGMPWETFRTNDYLKSTRPITLVTKGGALPGYYSLMVMVPEYGFGITILIAGNGNIQEQIRDVVVPAVVKYADSIAQKQLAERYAGVYVAPKDSGLNSTLTLVHSPVHGLVLQSLISNGTDVIAALVKSVFKPGSSVDNFSFYVVPTLLYQDEKHQRGERWRVVIVQEDSKEETLVSGAWKNFCITDMDFLSYAGLPVNEIIFWGGNEKKGEPALQAQLTAFRISLERMTENGGEGKKSATDWQEEL